MPARARRQITLRKTSDCNELLRTKKNLRPGRLRPHRPPLRPMVDREYRSQCDLCTRDKQRSGASTDDGLTMPSDANPQSSLSSVQLPSELKHP